ncbi:MAG: hypothetical protein K0Q97_758 [Bacillota bacterium]|nr:hypothetical protein [Bacillota bacterium]
MNIFYEKFIKPQNVAPESMLFSKVHITLSFLCVLFIMTILYFQMKHCDENYSKKTLKNSSIIMLLLEILRICWITYYYGFSLKNIRFDWCNQICLILPFIVLSENKNLFPYIDILAFVGGISVIIYPRWVFYDYAGLHIMAVQSMASHALMVIISISMIFTSDYWGKENDVRKPFIGFCYIAFIAFTMSRLLNTNYMLMLNADGIPLLENFTYPWYWFVAIPIVITVTNLAKLIFKGINNKIICKKDIITEISSKRINLTDESM